jgi:hypothetical protein
MFDLLLLCAAKIRKEIEVRFQLCSTDLAFSMWSASAFCSATDVATEPAPAREIHPVSSFKWFLSERARG